VSEGEIYAFLGLNGAGKTTTIRLLLGMIRPTTGSAWVLQTRVRLGAGSPGEGWDTWWRTRAPTELTVLENLEVARRLHPGVPRQAVDQIIERMGLSAYAERRTGNLSRGTPSGWAGQALLHQPRLLLLDRAS